MDRILKERENKQIEFKSTEESFFDFAVKDVDTKSGIVTGYFAAFNNIDSAFDMIVKGAFKKTIMEWGPNGKQRIKHVKQHSSDAIGFIQVLKEDNRGLYFESKMSAIEDAQDVLIQYAEGIYNEHSIGYQVIKQERVLDANGNFSHYELKEIKLYEGSTVLWGCNENTPITGFKSQNSVDLKSEIDLRMKQVIKAISLGNLKDETYQKLEIELLKIKEAYNSLIIPQSQKRTEEPKRLDTLKTLSNLLTIK